MSEPLTDRLSRLTPCGGPDRDALLFAAGRASVRPSRLWPSLALTLAATQTLTIGLLWQRAESRSALPDSLPGAVQPVEPPYAPDDPGTWTASRHLRTVDPDTPLTSISDLVPDPPSLRAFAYNDSLLSQ